MKRRLAYAAREGRDLALALLAFGAYLPVLLLPWRVVVGGAGFIASFIGVRIPRYRVVGLRNLAIAFPEMSEGERLEILRRSWDNMGRTAAEYFFLDRIWDYDPAAPEPGCIEFNGFENLIKLIEDGKPGIIVSAHLANWELPMIAAARHGLDIVALYVRPHNRWIARMVLRKRTSVMGDLVMSDFRAPRRLSRALANGGHLGLLVDHFVLNGPKIPFFGRLTEANQIFARLARHFNCPVHAVRVIRLPNSRFRIELTGELALPRDASGAVDVANAMKTVGSLFESWIQEHPDQWIWVHRRWR